MKRKIIRVMLALVLVLTFSLVTAVPAGAYEPVTRNVVPFTLEKSDGCTADWTTVRKMSGSSSVVLSAPGGGELGREARIKIDASAVGIETLGDIVSISWYEYLVSGYPPHIDVSLDFDNDGVRDDILVFEYAYNFETHYTTEAPMPYGAVTGDWYQTFSDDGDGPAVIEGDANAWLGSGPPGPLGDPSFIFGNLNQWQTGAVTGGEAVDANTVVLYFEIEVDNWGGLSEADVDDIAINGVTYYGQIQDAVDAAIGSDTISVAAGTYTEGLIDIDASMLIEGDPSDKPVISPTVDTVHADHRGWFQVTGTTVVDFKNLEFDGSGKNIENAIRYQDGSTGTVENCDFSNMRWDQYTGYAVVYVDYTIFLGGSPPALNLDPDGYIKGCTFTNIQRIGVMVFGVDKVYLQNNTYTGKGDGDWLDYGIEVGSGGVATIEQNNVINNCTGVALVDGSTSAGILVTTYYGAGTQATITGNTLTGNTEGIAVGYDGSDTSVVVAHYNNIVGNTTSGIASTAPSVDAKYNYWGDESGPIAVNFYGIGDSVSANVAYEPWLHTIQEKVVASNTRYYGYDLVELEQGWNIWSTPIALDGKADTWGEYKALGDGLNLAPGSNAYYFNSGAATPAWDLVTDSYKITPCDAIYIKMAAADTAPILFSPDVSAPSKTLYAGWNLVGPSYFGDIDEAENGGCLYPALALHSVYFVTGDNEIGYSQVVSPAVNQDAWFGLRGTTPANMLGDWEDMYICEGYWVNMVNGGTLVGMVFTPVSPLLPLP